MKRTLKNVMKFTAAILLVLITLVAAFGGISYYLYYSPEAADLPCRDCNGEARAVAVNGFDLYYRELGHDLGRSPVLLVHGGPGQSSQTFKDGFDFLADDYRVVFYDQRGSGNSQIEPGADLYTIDLLVEELETLRREVIGADKLILIAHSAGGALALRYAIAYPEHVEKLILVSALPPNGGQALGGVLMDTLLASMNVLAGNLPPADPIQADRQFNEMSFKTSIPRLYDPNRTDLLLDMGYASLAVNRDITRSTMGGNFDAQLSQLAFPALIIYGKGDTSSSTGESMARHFDEILPKSELVQMEYSGHWPYLEEPERFQTVLNEFLAR